jgi:anti-sigma-K factor RskA
MDLHRYPDLVDLLAAEYALGVLRGGARRRLEQLADDDPTVRAAIHAWQTRMGALVELGPPVAPPATAWEALERRLGLSPAGAAHAPGRLDTSVRVDYAATPARRKVSRWFESLGFWRIWSIGATGAAVAATIALALTLRPFSPVASPTQPAASSIASTDESAAATAEPAIERVSYIAALSDVKTNKTMVFVMWDDQSAMMSAHRMMGGDAPPAGKSEQLWGIPENGQPVSLGMLPPGEIVHMKVHGVNAFVKLAVSVEPPGGSTSSNGPSGPIVCAGRLKSTA